MTLALWGPGLLVLVFGAIAAVIAVAMLGRLQSRPSARDSLLRDLDERIEHALAQLRDLQLQEARIDPAFFALQRADLEERAAHAMRERDGVLRSADVIASGPDRPKRDAKADVSATVGWFAARPWARALVWVSGILAVGGVLAASLSLEQHPREGGSMTGGTQARGPMQGGAAPTDDAEVRALIARLQESPDDVEAMLGLVKRLLRAQMFDETEQLLARIKSIDPANPTARVYSAVMLAARGGGAMANQELDAVTHDHPELPDAWFFRGMLAMQASDTDRMRDSFEHFVAVAPPGPQRDRIRNILAGRTP